MNQTTFGGGGATQNKQLGESNRETNYHSVHKQPKEFTKGPQHPRTKQQSANQHAKMPFTATHVETNFAAAGDVLDKGVELDDFAAHQLGHAGPLVLLLLFLLLLRPRRKRRRGSYSAGKFRQRFVVRQRGCVLFFWGGEGGGHTRSQASTKPAPNRCRHTDTDTHTHTHTSDLQQTSMLMTGKSRRPASAI